MRLKNYLDENSISVADFARQIGARGCATVYRYIRNGKHKDRRIPDQDMMNKIFHATGGKVTANDFYDLAPPGVTDKHRPAKGA